MVIKRIDKLPPEDPPRPISVYRQAVIDFASSDWQFAEVDIPDRLAITIYQGVSWHINRLGYQDFIEAQIRRSTDKVYLVRK